MGKIWTAASYLWHQFILGARLRRSAARDADRDRIFSRVWASVFRSCELAGRITNKHGVANEETPIILTFSAVGICVKVGLSFGENSAVRL